MAVQQLGDVMTSLLWPSEQLLSGEASPLWLSHSTFNLPFCHFNFSRLLKSDGMKKNSFIKTIFNLSSVLCLFEEFIQSSVWAAYL